MLSRLKDRRMFVWLIFAILFLLLIFRLAQITVVNGDKYAEKALDYRLRKHTTIARRGEIYDRNGVLLAGNGTTLYLEYLYNYMDKDSFEKMAIDLFTLLENQNEEHIELPIMLEDGNFVYRSDYKKEKWLKHMDFPENLSAREVFDKISEREGIAIELNPYSRQRLLISKGLYLPIGLKDDENGKCIMEFSQDKEKRLFLDDYDLEYDMSAKDVFLYLRELYKVSEELSDKEASYVLTMKYHIKNLGYFRFEPIVIADHISKETSVLISEYKVDFPDVSIGIKPYRYYPLKNTCSHILGYMGTISKKYEIEKYTPENGYDKRDLIGKIGIEAAFEDVLHGRRGVKWYDVNSTGEVVGVVNESVDPKFQNTEPVSGLDIQLTIDTEFQKKVEKNVKKHLQALQSGGTYKSRFGDHKFPKKYKFARTAAVVVVDVESSEVLAMVSYPDYDVNLFTGGISVDDWMKLQGNNRNDPLGPKPMYNLATMMAVQPGSTFKMVTSFAALKEGFDPYRSILTKGVIRMSDGNNFGCWIWNKARGSHGRQNMMQAIANSCNYYFYCLGSGFDYGSNKPLGIKMGAEKIFEAAKDFGLTEASGVEIYEVVKGVPDPERKKHLVVSSLKKKLFYDADEYFDADISSDKMILSHKVDELIEFCLEKPKAPRYEVHRKIKEIFQMNDYGKLNKLTDMVKYDYMRQMDSFESDVFNISIGQGGNRYTPVQMARYVTTIANGGYLQNLTLIKSINGAPSKREPFKKIDTNGYIKYLQRGMREAVTGTYYKSYFNNYPVKVALKTGTAEREGKLSTLDEVEYIKKYCRKITSNSIEEIEERASEIVKERSIEIGELYSDIDREKDEYKLIELKNRLNSYNIDRYLDKGNAMRLAIKELSDYKIKDEDIDEYKEDYDNFSAVIAFAPYDKPKIAIAMVVPQGGSGSQCFSLLKEIIGDYLSL